MLRRLSGVLLALSVVALAACERPWDAGSLSSGSVVAPRALELTSFNSYKTGAGVTLLVGNPSAADETQTVLIGQYGGKINFNASALSVPPGAVGEDCYFTFTLKSTPYIAADLTAVKVSDGTPVTTFSAPLTLKLSYSKAITPVPDPRLLKVYWVRDGVVLGVQPTVLDRKGQTLYATLTHFSEYSPGLDGAY